MPEASPKIEELTNERNKFIDEQEQFEKLINNNAENLKSVLKNLEEYSITMIAHHHALYVLGNTRDYLIYANNALSRHLTHIKVKIMRLTIRIENLKKQNEGGGV